MKKTKAEKRLADLRRNLEFEQVDKILEYTPIPLSEDKRKYTALGNLTANIPSVQSQSLYIYPVQLIRKDLTKTLVLCILAISLELGLYVLLEKPGLLPF